MTGIKIWRKFYECCCHSEGIMAGYEYSEDGIPLIDLAFFKHGFDARQPIGLKDRIVWCWRMLTKGDFFLDMVMLDQNTAKELANDLLQFANRVYKPKA